LKKLALLIAFSAAAAFGALPIVQQNEADDNSGTGFTTKAVAFGSNEASGNLLVAVCAYYNNPTRTITVTDTAGNTWLTGSSLVTQSDGSASLGLQIFYVPYSKAGANTVTCNYSAAASFPTIQIFEIIGYSFLDQTSTGSGTTGTAIASASKTTLFNPELIFAANSNEASPPAVGLGGGYTVGQNGAVTGVGSEYKVQTTTAAQTGPFTAGASTVWAAAMCTFRARNNAVGIF
jgi:hypothetical protein